MKLFWTWTNSNGDVPMDVDDPTGIVDEMEDVEMVSDECRGSMEDSYAGDTWYMDIWLRPNRVSNSTVQPSSSNCTVLKTNSV